MSLASILSAHHLGEDEIPFLALYEMLPEAPYERLAVDNKKIEALLRAVRNSLEDMAANNAAGRD